LRAIKKGTVSATRDESTGGWLIEPVELHRVYPAVDASMHTALNAAPRSGDAEVEIRELRVWLADKVDRSERAAAAGAASWVMVAAVAWSTVSERIETVGRSPAAHGDSRLEQGRAPVPSSMSANNQRQGVGAGHAPVGKLAGTARNGGKRAAALSAARAVSARDMSPCRFRGGDGRRRFFDQPRANGS
jgi:hypothetical protein